VVEKGRSVLGCTRGLINTAKDNDAAR